MLMTIDLYYQTINKLGELFIISISFGRNGEING